jgi:hypothetical protein
VNRGKIPIKWGSFPVIKGAEGEVVHLHLYVRLTIEEQRGGGSQSCSGRVDKKDIFTFWESNPDFLSSSHRRLS